MWQLIEFLRVSSTQIQHSQRLDKGHITSTENRQKMTLKMSTDERNKIPLSNLSNYLYKARDFKYRA